MTLRSFLFWFAAGTTLVSYGAPNANAQQPLPPGQPYSPPQPQPYPQAQPQQPYPQQPPQPYPQAQPQQPYPQQQPPQPYPPQQPQPYPRQPYPPQQPQPYPPQPYPPQQQPYPPQPYPPQQQPYPPQPYPPQQPAPYGQPPYGQPQQPYMPPRPPAPAPAPPATGRDSLRGGSEMTFLYVASFGYGVGSGIWLDALAGVGDPGVAFIAPVALGVAMPIGVYFWDDNAPFHRGVPSSIATGLTLGAIEGIAVSGTQWQYSGGENPGANQWSFKADATLTFLTATGGGVGGWAFGEWLRPDPRSLSFIGSGAAWGAVSGTLFGAGVVGGDWKDGASIWGLVGYNAGILTTGALSTVYTPSYNTQKWMWLGYVGGTAAGFIVYPFYIGSDAPVRHGLIANALGGLGGIALAAAFTANMTDDEPTGPGHTKNFAPPFNVGVGPAPGGGATVTASGLW